MVRFLVGALVTGLALGVGAPAAAGPRESFEELTQRLMTLNVERQRGDAAARARAVEAQLSAAMAREQRLAELIANHPGAVLRHAVSAKLRAALPAAVQAHVEEELTTEGELEVLHEDRPDGSRYHYFMDRPEGRVSLHFAADAPALQTGDHVRVTGVRVRRAMALRSGSSALLQAMALPNTFGAQRTAVILVNFQDKPTQTWVTPAEARDIILAPDKPRSVTNFFEEASYGQTWLEGDVYGIYTIPLSSSGCNYSSIASYAKQAATAEVGSTKMATYRRFVYSFPSNDCGWSGLSTIGGNPSQAWINGRPGSGLVSHEMGHGFGLWHSHALLCDQGHTSVCSDGRHLEYGDTLDTMGAGKAPMHFNAVQKELLGWLNYGASPPITTVQSSGTYTIDPYEPDGSNPKALKVKTPSGNWYYMEYRQPIGFDASTLLYNQNVTNGLVVHLWSNRQSPDNIFLLNMRTTAPDWTYPALEVGSTFSDPESGITITPAWAEGTAGVNVTIGGDSSCVRGTPTVQMSPGQQRGRAGSRVSYTVSVTNNDTGCAAADFTQEASVPAGWAASFAAPKLRMAAGTTASTHLEVTSSAAAGAGTYAVSSRSSNAAALTSTGSATATYDVTVGDATGSFSDTFDRPDASVLGNGWTQAFGSLSIQDDRAVSQFGKAVHAATRPELAGATQSVTARFASGGNNPAPEFALLARYHDASNYYTCYRQTGGTSVLRISKVVGGVETVLGAAAVPNPGKGVPFVLGCQVEGTTLALTLNGARKLVRSDSTFATGSVGMSLGYRGANSGSAAASWADDFTATVR